MAQATLKQVLEEIKTLAPEELRQVELAVQSQLERPIASAPDAVTVENNAWSVLDSLIGCVDAPSDWAEEHDHYISGTPKRRADESA